MSWSIIVFLIIVGIIALLLEILVIPGVGVVGVAGFLSIVLGIIQAYSHFGFVAGNITLTVSIFILAALLFLSLRANTWKRFMLTTNIDSKVNEVDEIKIVPGTEGYTVSRLAPSGKARFLDELYEVHTQGEFVNEASEIIVVKVIKNKIIVKPKK